MLTCIMQVNAQQMCIDDMRGCITDMSGFGYDIVSKIPDHVISYWYITSRIKNVPHIKVNWSNSSITVTDIWIDYKQYLVTTIISEVYEKR